MTVPCVPLSLSLSAKFAGWLACCATLAHTMPTYTTGPMAANPAEKAKARPNPLPSAKPNIDDLTRPSSLAEVKLIVMKEKPQLSHWSLTNSGLSDAHVQSLCEVCQASQCGLTELDLSFNKLTDAGLLGLCEFLAREGLAAHALTGLRLGGNPAITAEAQGAVVELFKTKRPDVTLDFAPTLLHSQVLLIVGKVFPDSPAAAAGLRRDDNIVALGTFNMAGREPNRGFKSEAERLMDNIMYFRGVGDSLKPLVQAKAESGGEIDVVVQRGSQYLPLTLRPCKWSGEGLLGCKIGPPPEPSS